MSEVADTQHTVADLEERFWTEGGGDPDFWSRHFAEDGLIALAMGIMGKPATVEAMRQAAPWIQASLDDVRFVQVTDDVAALTYRATARRAGDEADYTAVVSSVYARRDGDWLLVLHQQTPSTPS